MKKYIKSADVAGVKYAIQSTSEDGVYYLVNGWNRYNSYWQKSISDKTLFKSPADAKRSLTKLLKVMEDYIYDTFELIEVDETTGTQTSISTIDVSNLINYHKEQWHKFFEGFER